MAKCVARKKAKAYVRDNFPANSLIRRDDVAKPLIPVMTVNEELKKYLDSDMHQLREDAFGLRSLLI